MKSLAKKFFYNAPSNTPESWVCPGGVKKLKVIFYEQLCPSISVGRDWAGGYTYDGDVYCWGLNASGVIGNNSAAPVSSPVAVAFGGRKLVQIASGLETGYALDSNGDAYGWGNNGLGRLGDGTVTNRSTPVLIIGGVKFKKIAIMNQSIGFAGIDENNDIWTFGSNNAGQLGDNTIIPKSSPILVSAGVKFIDVALSAGHCLAIDVDNRLWAWGNNGFGQLGLGDQIARSTPTLVSSFTSKVYKVFAGGVNDTSFIISEFGTYAFGNNGSGQLGLGDTTPRSSPVLITGFQFQSIAASDVHTLGITDRRNSLGGQLWAWGSGFNGRLGDGTIVAKSTPTLVLGNIVPAYIGAGEDHSVCLDQNGQLWAWGNNNSGQLGDGTVVPKSSPVAVLSPQLNFRVPNINEQIKLIDVNPGETYKIAFDATGVYFGGINISNRQATAVLLEYYT